MAEASRAASPRAILFRDADRSIVLIDGPRSIEEAQVPSSELEAARGSLKRLVLPEAIDKPYKTPEPKDSKGALSDSLWDLMSAAAAADALDVLRRSYTGPWCLPRVVVVSRGVHVASAVTNRTQKRKRDASDDAEEAAAAADDDKEVACPAAIVPKGSRYLHGTISSERDRFLREAPQFDLVVLDPPWPNRSARRKKKSYNVADNLDEIRRTLSLLPLAAHLAPDGLVAVWVTNKTSVVGLLTGPKGLFAEWGLEEVAQWTWLKVTAFGDPIVDVNSQWRKPWERLLIARRRGSHIKLPFPTRTIISVPEVHSRKPNLRGLFEDIFPPDYKGLEVFARNLTAGWWSWGDEVLKYQQTEHWAEP